MREIKNGTITQSASSIKESIIPKLLPKISLKIAPVWPIIADIFIRKRISILHKSIGLRALSNTTGFSIG